MGRGLLALSTQNRLIVGILVLLLHPAAFLHHPTQGRCRRRGGTRRGTLTVRSFLERLFRIETSAGTTPRQQKRRGVAWHHPETLIPWLEAAFLHSQVAACHEAVGSQRTIPGPSFPRIPLARRLPSVASPQSICRRTFRFEKTRSQWRSGSPRPCWQAGRAFTLLCALPL